MRIQLLFMALLSMIMVNAQTQKGTTTLFEDSFESYTDFSITDIGSWITLDLDESPTMGDSEFYWNNRYQPHAFIVFNPNNTISATKVSDFYSAKEGTKYMGSWGAIIPKEGEKNRNDDWLISPQIQLGASANEVSFWVKSLKNRLKIEAGSVLENYTVGIYTGSATPTSSDDFTLIANISDADTLPLSTTPDWEQKTFNLDAFANQKVRIGIHNVSKNKYFFMIDDFKVTTATLGTQDFFAQNFSVFPNPAQDVLNIAAKNGMEIKVVQITDLNGRIVKTATAPAQTATQINIADLTTGVYFVSVRTNEGTATSKFLKN
ncbi:T9SS type A sorting domain-containing protein [Flavobacterium sp. CAU 1735]|uniref:T9SS-dependent choice-of-anchor J family protein n=1 Tax=Flavobacterium sp. CAU 1735 TaxID=3140361 RepID=UPI003260EEE7